MKFPYMAAAAAIITVSLAACDNGSRFKVDGEVYGAEGKSLVLEKSDFHGRWIAVDSTKVDGNGRFSIKSETPASPEIYRLSLGDSFIYLPVDSTETVTVTTTPMPASAILAPFSMGSAGVKAEAVAAPANRTDARMKLFFMMVVLINVWLFEQLREEKAQVVSPVFPGVSTF